MLSSVLVILHVYPTRQLRHFLQFCRFYFIHSPRSLLLTILYFMCPLLFLHKIYYAPITRMSTAALIIFSHVSNLKAGLTFMKIFFRVHSLSYEYQHLQMFKNDKIEQAGVSITTEVASRFEKSNRL